MTFVISWLPHALGLFLEEFYGKMIIPHVVPLLVCKTTLVWTPLMIFLFDRRLRISYFRSNANSLTLDLDLDPPNNDKNSKMALLKVYELS